MSRDEKNIRAEIERMLGSMPEVLIMSNPSGQAEFTRLRQNAADAIQGIPDLSAAQAPISYGLGGQGGPDLIGLLHVQHTTGVRWAVVFGVEVKAPGKHRSKAQVRWHLRGQARGMWICEEASGAAQVRDWLKGMISGLAQAGVVPVPADAATLQRLRALST